LFGVLADQVFITPRMARAVTFSKFFLLRPISEMEENVSE
jgi:hypothetical protein